MIFNIIIINQITVCVNKYQIIRYTDIQLFLENELSPANSTHSSFSEKNQKVPIYSQDELI